MTQTPDAKPFTIAPLLFTAAAGSLSMMAFVAVIAPMARLLGLAPWHVGAAVTCGGVAWVVMARFWGVRSDRLGRRRVLLLALAGFAVSYAALGLFLHTALNLIPAALISVLGIVGLRTLAGGFYAAVPPVCAALVADNSPPDQRTRAMGGLGAASALGMVVGPGGAGLLAGWNLSASLLLISILPALALIVIWRALPHDAPKVGRKAMPLKLTDPRLRRPIFTGFAAMCSVIICQVIVGFLALDRFGLSPHEAARVSGLALAVVGGMLFASQMLLRQLKAPPSRLIRVGASVAAIGFLLTFWAPSVPYLYLAYGVIAAGMGWVYPSLSALAANAVEPHEQGAAAGAVASAQGLGTIMGPILGTAAYGVGTGAPFALSALLIFAAALWPSRSGQS